MTELQRVWAPREDRLVSPVPTEIPSHPDYGLPPCEHQTALGQECPRLATTNYGYAYLCSKHARAVYASEDFDSLELALHHIKRMLWRARVDCIERLECHLCNALSELELEHKEAREKMNAACEEAADY